MMRACFELTLLHHYFVATRTVYMYKGTRTESCLLVKRDCCINLGVCTTCLPFFIASHRFRTCVSHVFRILDHTRVHSARNYSENEVNNNEMLSERFLPSVLNLLKCTGYMSRLIC